MQTHRFSRALAALLTVLILAQLMCLSVFAAESTTLIIPAGSDTATVNEILSDALLNSDNQEEWEYRCSGTSSKGVKNTAWGSIAGFTSEKKVLFTQTTFTHPALADNDDGEYQVRVVGTTDEYTVRKLAKEELPAADIRFKESASATLLFNDDSSLDAAATKAAIFDAVLEYSDTALTVDDVTITYYATSVTGSIGSLGKAWISIEGGKSGALTYPAISAGEQNIRISWPGNDINRGFTEELTVNMIDRDPAPYTLNDSAAQVTLRYNDDVTADFDILRTEIFNAVVAQSDVMTADNVTVSYYATSTSSSSKAWMPLEGGQKSLLTYPAISEGEQLIRISWPGNRQYAPTTIEVSINVVDTRTESIVVLKSGVSFTYNKDTAVTKQYIFDKVIDWKNSNLPAKNTLSVDDFTFTYKAKLSLLDGIAGDAISSIVDKIVSDDKIQTAYVPFEGVSYDILGQTIGSYPPIGAGEKEIKVVYSGNADYKPGSADGMITIRKAGVLVGVKSASMYVSQAKDGLNLVSTYPADDFDTYVLYNGVTSNATLNLYLQLPARYTENALIIKTIDGILASMDRPTLTEMMQNGISFGELRELINSADVTAILEKMGVDATVFNQIIATINMLPDIGDNIRICFGVPNVAGIYSVTAITNNKNYNIGIGLGALVLKADKAELVWNQDIGRKLSAADAQDTDFGATLMVNDEAVKDQSNVHVLYSGMTSKLKVYSSTTTAPTEPGSYTMTVTTLGGNYLAAPIIRSFQITK